MECSNCGRSGFSYAELVNHKRSACAPISKLEIAAREHYRLQNERAAKKQESPPEPTGTEADAEAEAKSETPRSVE